MTYGNRSRCSQPVYAGAHLCRYSASVLGVDGQPYCRGHAAKLERELDAWAETVAWYERFATAPATLPSHLAAEWRNCYRDIIYPAASDPDHVIVIRIEAARRLWGLERDAQLG